MRLFRATLRRHRGWMGLPCWALAGAVILGLNLPPCVPIAVEAVQATSGAATSVSIGQPAPELTLSDLSGGVKTVKTAQGRPLILNFWATWCAPCREEMPLLQQAYDIHRQAGLIVLAISLDTADRAAAARTYWVESGWTFASLLDPDGVAAGQYQVLFLPSTIFINAQGVVSAIHRGPINATQLQQYLATIVVSQSTSHDATQ